MSNDKTLKDVAMSLDDGNLYTPVHERVKYFNENYPEGGIETMILSLVDSDRKIIKALVTPDYLKNPQRRFTGHSEAFYIADDKYMKSALEVAETSAVGRALGNMGIGIIGGMASANEIAKNKAAEKAGKKTTTTQTPTGDETAEVESIIEVINGIEKVEDLREIRKQIKESGLSREAIKKLGDVYNSKMKELKNA